MVDLLQRARLDLGAFLGAEWGVDLSIAPTAASAFKAVRGLATKHHIAIDPETGQAVNVKNVHVSVAETALIAAGYTVRNAGGEVALKNHIVKYADSTGTIKTYQVNEQFPDETLGIIVLILGDYA